MMKRLVRVSEMLKIDVPRCMARFVAVDGLQHLCDELQGHGSKHYCLIHNLLEREGLP
jgi:hypothetical protein